MQIMLKKLSNKAVTPTHGSKFAAGYDLHVTKGGWIPPLGTRMFHTDLAMSYPNGYFGAIVGRSSVTRFQAIRPVECMAAIDPDYTGEISVPLHNDSIFPRRVKTGQRVAQMIILPCQYVQWVEVSELTQTERGDNGYGSTGH